MGIATALWGVAEKGWPEWRGIPLQLLGVNGNSTHAVKALAGAMATKAGLEGMTKALCRELASREVTVNAVAPGFIDTEMTAQLPDEARAAYLTLIPLGRLGRAEEVAAAVAFLCSPESSYVTGHVLAVNGGLYT